MAVGVERGGSADAVSSRVWGPDAVEYRADGSPSGWS